MDPESFNDTMVRHMESAARHEGGHTTLMSFPETTEERFDMIPYTFIDTRGEIQECCIDLFPQDPSNSTERGEDGKPA